MAELPESMRGSVEEAVMNLARAGYRIISPDGEDLTELLKSHDVAMKIRQARDQLNPN